MELKNNNNYCITICNTEQQKELYNSTLLFFDLISDINLNIMILNQNLSNIQLKILNKFFIKEYDGVIIQEDTIITLLEALIGFYNKIHIFHI